MRQEFKDVHEQLIHTITNHTNKHIDCFVVRHWKQKLPWNIEQKIVCRQPVETGSVLHCAICCL